MKRIEIAFICDLLRKEFLHWLTFDSETQDARRKDFNQGIFDDKEGWACYTNTDLDMVMEKFDRAVKELVKPRKRSK